MKSATVFALFGIVLLLYSTCAGAQIDAVTPLSALQATQIESEMLVLTDGRIVEGVITPRPDGYDIALKVGRMFVPSERVRFQASNRNEAYLKLRKSLPELTPNRHMELARWCEQNGLYEQACRELLDALNLDPNREEAKRLLQANLARSGQGKYENVGAGDGLSGAVSASGRELAGRSLGGFSNDTARMFVQRVQPIIVNRCASGGCHTATHELFAVHSTRQGSTPLISERNLASVLKQVDLAGPLQSRLLQAPMESHGGLSSPVFRGRSGKVQWDTLRDWVVAASEEIAPGQRSSTLSSSSSGSIEEQGPDLRFVAAVNQEDRGADLGHSGFTGGSVHGRKLSASETDDRFLNEVAHMNRQDAFDPEVFNRKYRGSALVTDQFQKN